MRRTEQKFCSCWRIKRNIFDITDWSFINEDSDGSLEVVMSIDLGELSIQSIKKEMNRFIDFC